MWLSRLVLAIGIVALVGCANTRLQSVGSILDSRDVGVHVVEVSGRTGQLYSRQLRDRFEGGVVSHDLSTSLSQSSSSVVSVRGTGSQLKKMTMTAALTLTDRATGEVVLSDTVSATATLGAVSAYFAQTRSDRHGAERLAVLLADRAAARVNLFFLNQDEK
jgi:hypothetical protein